VDVTRLHVHRDWSGWNSYHFGLLGWLGWLLLALTHV